MSSIAPVPGPTPAAPVLRRVVVYGLLFVLVVLVANGLDALLHRLVDQAGGTSIAESGTGGLAVSLTFALIGGPLAALLGWFAWRRLADPAEQRSLAWALYLVGMVTVSLVVASTALLGAVADAVTGDRFGAAATTGVVWGVVWAGHRQILVHTGRRPSRLPGTAAVLGGTFGLLLGASGAVMALTILLDTAIGGQGDLIAGDPWWLGAVRALVAAVGGAAVWGWHWRHEGGRAATTPLAGVALVGVGILGGCLMTLAGTGTILFVLLRLAVDRTEPVPVLVEPLGLAIAASAVGGLVWGYHRGVVHRRDVLVREAGILVTGGIALIAAATGTGVIVNALLAALTTPLTPSDPRTLLLAGLSSLLVGGPLWWGTWRPTRAVDVDRRRSPGRSVYLVVVFGISAVVALITLLVIGYRLFDSLLGGDAGLLESVRAPLGLLVATGLVAGYHFGVWRADRSATAGAPVGAATAPLPSGPAIVELVLVMGAGGEPVARHLRQVSGARVTYWKRGGPTAALPSPEMFADALAGVSGERVLVMVAPDGAVAAIPVTVIPDAVT